MSVPGTPIYPTNPESVTPRVEGQPVYLTEDEKRDLRRRVLNGYTMTITEARAVMDTLRGDRAAAVLGDEERPKKRGAKKSKGLSDEELDKSLDSALDM